MRPPVSTPTRSRPRGSYDLVERPRIDNYPRFLSAERGVPIVKAISTKAWNQNQVPGTWSLRAPSFTVRLGDQNLLNDGAVSAIDVPVSKVVRHAEFLTRTLRNDVAVLTMEHPVTFNEIVKPVCLPHGDDFNSRDLNGSYAFLTGWATVKSNGNTRHVLKQAQIKMWYEDSCNKVFRLEASTPSVHLCAGDNRHQATCPGISGGVLVLPENGRYFLIGVVSTGIRCATGDYPSLYTRVTEFMPWLSERLQ
ncbi:hypothetical protein HPB50_014286 [Hyalomma asiaticum]|uniref:Uncharacterized protein n=1 Tax=Hyalomma asiaticum TaxID=266040 RepID=A0ACB7TKL4_HYAAI|nr:hypothetical protein HPB50_014286 [Hyalomma asiaticum]